MNADGAGGRAANSTTTAVAVPSRPAIQAPNQAMRGESNGLSAPGTASGTDFPFSAARLRPAPIASNPIDSAPLPRMSRVEPTTDGNGRPATLMAIPASEAMIRGLPESATSVAVQFEPPSPP